jgi:hypothetical protein
MKYLLLILFLLLISACQGYDSSDYPEEYKDLELIEGPQGLKEDTGATGPQGEPGTSIKSQHII